MKINGFLFAGINCGIKKNKKDLGLIYCPDGASFATVATKNKFCSPTVTYARNIQSTAKQLQAILVNSGNANALTGSKGYADIETLLGKLGSELGTDKKQSISLSTGIIGRFLPIDTITEAMPKLKANLAEDVSDFSEAILTTDTRKKVISKKLKIGTGEVNILGVCKGSGMIAPNMATMFAFILTDAIIDSDVLRTIINEVTETSFNAISVDGDASTNDTFIMMASNKGAKVAGIDIENFKQAVKEVSEGLAQEIIRDAEGITKFVELKVNNASSAKEAKDVFQAIANSPLVKTAWFGENPNFGRILCSAGKIESNIIPEKTDLLLGEHLVVSKGAVTSVSKDILDSYMKNDELVITLNLNIGNFNYKGWTCDLSHEYVTINAEYN